MRVCYQRGLPRLVYFIEINIELLDKKKKDSHWPNNIFPKEGGGRDTFVGYVNLDSAKNSQCTHYIKNYVYATTKTIRLFGKFPPP